MKIVIIPDSFKGSIDAFEAAEIIAAAAKKFFPNGEIMEMPMADGGEGTVSCIYKSLGGTLFRHRVTAPFGGKTDAKWLYDGAHRTAFIESAEVVGLPKVRGFENPETSTTAGIGELICRARDMGAKKIVAAIGGTCTNDCGAGMLSAMGAEFLDKSGNPFVPVGKTLGDVCKIVLTKEFESFENIEFEVMCDVKNPLCGDLGCAAVFGPQKGADRDMVRRLDDAAWHFADVAAKTMGKDMSQSEGAGAAGGLGYAFGQFLNGTLRRGADVILDLYGFDQLMKDTDLVITGEGSFDLQSLMGKAVGCILDRAGKTAAAVFCGHKGVEELFGNVRLIEISRGMPTELAIACGKENLRLCAEEFFEQYRV